MVPDRQLNAHGSVGTGSGAATVEQVTRRRCRSTSFYLAPGEKRSFGTTAVWAYHNGEVSAILHRNDFTQFEHDHPRWDGTCFVGDRLGDERRLSFDELVEERSVALRHIDARTAQGRTPHNISNTVHTLGAGRHVEDLTTAVRQHVGDPQKAAAITTAVDAAPTPADAAHRLRFLSAAARVLDVSSTAKLANYTREWNCGIANVGMSQTSLSAQGFERWSDTQRLSMLKVVWREQQLSTARGAIEAAFQTSRAFGAGHPWRQQLSDIANTNPDVWTTVFAEYLDDSSDHNILTAFDLDTAFIDTLSRAHRNALAACALHRNGSSEQLERLMRVRGWEQLARGFAHDAQLDADRAQLLAGHLRRSRRVRRDFDEAMCATELAAAACEAAPSTEDVFVEAACSWLGHIRRVGKNAYYGNLQLQDRRIDMSVDGSARIRKHLELGPTMSIADAQLAELILSSDRLGEKFRTRLSREFGDERRERRTVRRGIEIDWAAAPDTWLEQANHAARHHQSSQYVKLSVVRAAVIDERFNRATYNTLVDGCCGSYTQRDAARALWQVVREDDHSDEQLAAAASRYGFSTLDVLGAVAATGGALEPRAARTLKDMPLSGDPEHYAAMAMTGTSTVLPCDPYIDDVASTSAQVGAAALTATVWPDAADAASELPRAGDGEWHLNRSVVNQVDGTRMSAGEWGNLDVTVISDIHTLRHNAREMRNCTASYADRIRDGTSMILALRDSSGETALNVELTCEHSGRWEVGEVETWANSGVPEPVRERVVTSLRRLLY